VSLETSQPIQNTKELWCREGESNPHSPFGPADFKSAASANFAIPARLHVKQKYILLTVKTRVLMPGVAMPLWSGRSCPLPLTLLLILGGAAVYRGVSCPIFSRGFNRRGTPLTLILIVRSGHLPSCL
jgi:hypothetical protein